MEFLLICVVLLVYVSRQPVLAEVVCLQNLHLELLLIRRCVRRNSTKLSSVLCLHMSISMIAKLYLSIPPPLVLHGG